MEWIPRRRPASEQLYPCSRTSLMASFLNSFVNFCRLVFSFMWHLAFSDFTLSKVSVNTIPVQTEPNWRKKIKRLEKAAQLFKRDNFVEKYHHALGYARLWRTHDQNLSISKAINFTNHAADHFEKAGNKAFVI